jgi:hypothetical protein
MVTTTHALVLDKSNEHLLVGCPIFEDVPTRREQAHQSDIEQEVMRYSMVTFSVVKHIVNTITVLKLFCG